MINDCKLRITVKHEIRFEKNLLEFGWTEAANGLYTKDFGTNTKAEIHRKILPFSGHTYFSVYITAPDSVSRKIIYDIAGELEKIEAIHN